MTGAKRWRRVTTAALMAAAIVIPIGASAQDKVAVTVGAGGLFDDRFPGTHFSEPLVSGSIQRVFLRFLVLEGDLTFWQHA